MIYGNYYSGDVLAHLLVAQEQGLKVYFEYLPKRKILRPIQAHVLTIYNDHVIVVGADDRKIKRLNYDRIFRIGIEIKNA